MRVSSNASYGSGAIIRTGLCLVGMLTLVTFVTLQGHQFTDHFRAPEVRRSTERHTVLIESRNDASDKITVAQRLSRVPVVDAKSVTRPLGQFDSSFVPTLPITRLLVRLKLGPSRSGGQDPLI